MATRLLRPEEWFSLIVAGLVGWALLVLLGWLLWRNRPRRPSLPRVLASAYLLISGVSGTVGLYFVAVEAVSPNSPSASLAGLPQLTLVFVGTAVLWPVLLVWGLSGSP